MQFRAMPVAALWTVVIVNSLSAWVPMVRTLACAVWRKQSAAVPPAATLMTSQMFAALSRRATVHLSGPLPSARESRNVFASIIVALALVITKYLVCGLFYPFAHVVSILVSRAIVVQVLPLSLANGNKAASSGLFDFDRASV